MSPMIGLHDLFGLQPRPRGWIEFVLGTPVVLWVGWPILRKFWFSLVHRTLNMYTLIGLGVIGAAYLVAVLIALPIGIVAAVKQYSWFDHVATTFAFIGFSLPTFFTGVLLILIFSVHFGWLPSIYNTQVHQPLQMLKQAILPIAVLALFQTASLTRYTRASVLDNVSADYVRTARAKGLTERKVIMRHVVRNSLIPVVTLMALQLPAVFTGAVVTEQIFRVPGIGSLLIASIENSDTPVVMAITFVFAILVVICNLLADLLYAVLDPRIKYA